MKNSILHIKCEFGYFCINVPFAFRSWRKIAKQQHLVTIEGVPNTYSLQFRNISSSVAVANQIGYFLQLLKGRINIETFKILKA